MSGGCKVPRKRLIQLPRPPVYGGDTDLGKIVTYVRRLSKVFLYDYTLALTEKRNSIVIRDYQVIMQEEKRTIRQLPENDAPRKGKGFFDAGYRTNGGMMEGKDAFQRQSSSSTVVQDMRRRNSTWLTRKGSGFNVRCLCPIPKTPSSGNFPCAGDTREALERYRPLPEQRISTEEVKTIMKTVVEARLSGTDYSTSCSQIARDLADSLKHAAKARLCDRYKLICFVAIGQVDSNVTCSSRGIWSPTADTFVDYIFKNHSLFALCILYAVYQE